MIIGTKIKDKSSLLIENKIGNLKKTFLSKDDLNKRNENQFELFEDFRDYQFKDPVSVWDALSDLPGLDSEIEGFKYNKRPQNDYQKYLRKNSKKIYNHKKTPHSKETTERILLVKQGENFKNLPEHLRTKSVHSGAYGRLSANGLSPTITTRFDTPSTGRVIHPFENRSLTVREAARLQSFPDNFIFHGSRTSQGKQVGNAVPPLVGKSIGEMFKNDFLL